MNNKGLFIKIVSVLLITVIAASGALMHVYAENTNPTLEDPFIVVSLGDSYSSGEGIEPFYGQYKDIPDKVDDEGWLAHRSLYSWSSQLTFPGILPDGRVLGDYVPNFQTLDDGASVNINPNFLTDHCEWYFVASSGATTTNLRVTRNKENPIYVYDYYEDYDNILKRKKIPDEYVGKQKKEIARIWDNNRNYEYLEKLTTYLPNQLEVFDSIDADSVDYVTLSIGGNDIGFTDIVTRCVTGSSYLWHYAEFIRSTNPRVSSWTPRLQSGLVRKFNKVWENIEETKDLLKQTYRDIHNKAPNATIIVAGYPELFDRKGNGAVFSYDEANYVDDQIAGDDDKNIKGLDDVLQEVVEEMSSEMDIEYVSVVKEFKGHQAYSKDDNGNDINWINPLMRLQSEDLNCGAPWISDYSIHPNKEGAEHYAKCVNEAIEQIESRKQNQNQKGTLSGKVCKASDRVTPIQGATVTFYRGISRVAYSSIETDENGSYSVELPVGEYRSEISADGYIKFSSYSNVVKDETTYTETFLMVEGDPSNKGIAEGTISNALTGSGVSDVNLTVRRDWNNADKDTIVSTTKTASNGHYSVELPLGNYTVIAEKDGYAANSFNIVVQQGTTSNQNGVITPLLSGEDFRIVLTWGESPSDLDSHVEGTKSNGDDFHVYYSHKSEYDGDKEICNLDVDDTNSYGPETITLHATESSPYYYYIHRYSSSGNLGSSEAKIEIYQGEKLIASYNVPTNMENYRYWNVFAIKDGQLIVKNTITDEADTAYVESNSYKTVYSIAESDIESTENLNMVEWHPLEGLTTTMLGFNTDDTSIDISADGTWTKTGNLVSKPMEIVDSTGTVLDAAGFVMNWASNSQEITQLRVTTGKNKTIQIYIRCLILAYRFTNGKLECIILIYKKRWRDYAFKNR